MIQPIYNQILIKQILINQLNQILILEPVSVDLKKLTFDKKVTKNDLSNAKIKYIKDKIPYITNLATKAALDSKINKVNGEIPSITNLV